MRNFPILLVEDSEDDVFFFERAMKEVELSNPLHVVGDGLQAIAYLAGEGDFGDRKRYPIPGLVALDLNLPKKRGLEVLQWIRKHSNVQTVPVVVLTTSHAESDMNEAYRLGANSYLVKPLGTGGWAELLKVIKSYWVLNNQPPPQMANSTPSQPQGA